MRNEPKPSKKVLINGKPYQFFDQTIAIIGVPLDGITRVEYVNGEKIVTTGLTADQADELINKSQGNK